jgi:hypothetical protein
MKHVKESRKKKHGNLAEFDCVPEERIRIETVFKFVHSATRC